MDFLNQVCRQCIADWGKCQNPDGDNCCIYELKKINPDANGDFIFFYCCILKCGFTKHNCDRCLITKSGVIKFVKVKELEKPSNPAQQVLCLF